MGNDGIGAPLSRRVPGEARPGSGQPVPPVLSESVLNRMQAAIDAEHAHAEVHRPGEPNTEPLPRVTGSRSPSKPAAKPAPSPSGMLPEIEVQPDRPAKPERVAKPLRAARSPRAEEPLRIAKALRAAEEVGATAEVRAAEEVRGAAELRAAEGARVRAAEPQPPSGVEAEAPWPVQPPPAEPMYSAPPPAADPPREARPGTAAAYGSQATPGTIGWLWPEATDTRGAGGGGPRWQPPRRWRYRTATLVAIGAVVLAAAGLVIGMSLHSSPVAGASGKPSHKATASSKASATPVTSPTPVVSSPPDPAIAADLAAAATWITQQVGAGAAVACDAQTCPVLTASGFPAAQQVQIQVNPQSLSSAGIVVVTPAVRVFFSNHPGLGADIAPEILASFGPISVQAVDPAGGSAYQTALSQDVQARIQVGQQLLNSGDVTAAPVAETQLVAGDVDSRLLLAIQALSQQQPVHIVAFADSGPGASAGIPFRAAELGETDPTGAMLPTAYVQSMITVLNAHATFPAVTHARQVNLGDGQTVGEIDYALPLQLGLLG
jgi:hypothetical protein